VKISLLVANLSSNSIVRTYPIAKVLERHYEVEIIGPYFGDHLFPAYGDEFDFKSVRGARLPHFLATVNRILERITGDVVYAFKPRPTSFGIGLLEKVRRRKPLVLDIEDWETHGYFDYFDRVNFIRKCILRGWRNPNAFQYTYLINLLTKFADQVTVASTFLQKRYGGVILYHGANTKFFDPMRYDRERLRERWGIDDEKIILFAGTPRLHKGIDDLIKAMDLLDVDEVKLMIVGGQKSSPYIKSLLKKGGDRVIHISSQPHSLMPHFLSLADLVVLPQRDTFTARAQMPGKIFEAMAMAKPIVATALSDLPKVLEGCGIVVEPQNIGQLAEGINWVLENEDEAREMGARAREKCIREYSWDAMEGILTRIFDQYSNAIQSLR